MGTLVQVATYIDPEEAFVAQSYLRSGNIISWLNNEYILNANPALRVGVMGFRLIVPEEESELAREALHQIPKSLPAGEKISEARACSTCGGKAFLRRRHQWFFPIAYFFGAPFLPYAKLVECKTCGHVQEID